MVIIAWGFAHSGGNNTLLPEEVEATMALAATQSNSSVATAAIEISLTAPQYALTVAAPTMEVVGKQELRQFAAAANSTSQAGEVERGAVQAAGKPNSLECGDVESAWSAATPTETAFLNVYFPQLVIPTQIIIHQNNNPGYIRQIIIHDAFGEDHIAYDQAVQPISVCPFQILITVNGADYPANSVSILLDQSTNVGGSSQIDAVELIGTKY